MGKRKNLLLVLLSCLLVLICVPSYIAMADDSDSGNYLKNGSFESDIYDDSNGWSREVGSWDNDMKLACDDSGQQVKSGEHALHWYCAAENSVTMTQNVTLPAGTYTLGGFASGADSTVELSVLSGDKEIKSSKNDALRDRKSVV